MRRLCGPLIAIAAYIAPIEHLRPAVAAESDAIQVPDAGSEVSADRREGGVVHISAATQRDLFFAQGYVHALDRFFQMDVFRRRAAGRLAELVGQDALAEDIEFRVIGVQRAAERSLASLTPETQAALAAYAEGVNAFLAANDLPPEYAVLQVSKAGVEPWTPLDSVAVVKLIAFDLSFDLDDIERTETLLAYQEAGEEKGINGAALFFEDLNRSAPFTRAATIPDGRGTRAATELADGGVQGTELLPELRPGARELARDYLSRAGRLRSPADASGAGKAGGGSNAWVVSGRRSCSRRPILANDPHLDLLTPPLFYPIHLAAAEGRFQVSGASIPGAPFVAFGHNRRISWGSVVNQFDLTDVYQERIVPDSTSPSAFSTVHGGVNEPVIPLPEEFRVNRLDGGTPDSIQTVPPGTAGVPRATLIVPRRNNGPIIALNQGEGTALSVQYVGFSATRELDGFRLLNTAGNLQDFRHALQFIDSTGQNFVYADIGRNIAFFSSGEVPLREDLQAGQVRGAPPFLIRNGVESNEWIKREDDPGEEDSQALAYEILPFAELPQIVDPPAGFVVTANNDPLGITLDNDPLNQPRRGGGILYLSARFNIGIRAERITDLLRAQTAGGCVSVEDTERIQADVVLLDAQVFTPLIVRAFRNAGTSSAPPELAGCAADPGLAAAVNRLRRWNYSTPTGIREGLDANDDEQRLRRPSASEIEASVAATIYSAWRGQMLRNTIDATVDELGVPEPYTQDLYVTALRNLLDNFAQNRGIGWSGVDFFSLNRIENACQAPQGAPGGAPAPGLTPEARRNIFILTSLAQALERLSGPEFAQAFGQSPNQEDYRWGRLHRVVLPHPLGERFSINSADKAFQPFGDELPGAPTDGGFETVDAASHSPRANSEDDFMFDDGPIHRYVAQLGQGPGSIRVEYSLAGGISGVPGSPLFANLFREWLTNEYFLLR
jgi:penicillin amidase